jgi:hypothetical protein
MISYKGWLLVLAGHLVSYPQHQTGAQAMQRTRLILVTTLLLVFVVAILAATWIRSTIAASAARSRADLTPTSTPDSPDTAAITALLVRSSAVCTAALKDFATTPYPSVFIDDPAVPLSAEKAAFVNAVRARYGTAAATFTGNGGV